MRDSTVNHVVLGGLFCLAVLVAYAISTLTGLDAKMAQALPSSEGKPLMELIEEVTLPENRVITVKTVQKVGETAAECVTRHNANVAAVQAGG